MKKLQSYCVLILLILTKLIVAQNYSFNSLTMDSGLSNFVVTSFYKDSTGFVWIGTDNCVDRFDGTEVKHFPFKSGNINKKRVRCIAETRRDEIYAGNGLGLWRLNREQEEMEKILSENIDCAVNSLVWDAKGKKLYIGTEKGLFILYKNHEVKFFAPEQNVLSLTNDVTGLSMDDNGIIWMATRKGLVSFNSSNNDIRIIQNSSRNPDQNSFNKMTRIGKTLYMGTSNAGIMSFDISNGVFSRFSDVGSDIITDISGDGKRNLYVATDGNGVHFVSHFDGQVIQSIRYNPHEKGGIRSNSVYSLMVDRDGIVWVGFYQAGLDHSLYQNLLFNTYTFPPHFESGNLPVRTFIIQDKEKLIGTREGLYYIQESKNKVYTFTRKELRSNLVLSLCFHKGKFFVGTYGGGASVLNPVNATVIPLGNQNTLLKGHVFHFEEDRNGNLWLATSGGLYRYTMETGEIVNFNSSNSQLLAGNVYYIFFDSTGKGWIATENGLCIFDSTTNTIKSNIFPDNFFNKEIIKVIYEDSKQRLFFCPDKGNVFISDIHMREFSNLSMTKRFQGRIFLSVLEDKNNNYWFGSDNGLLSMAEGVDAYHSFGFIDGIPNPVFNTDAIFQDSKGLLWFGNSKGLLWVDPNQIEAAKRIVYPLQFTDFSVNGKSVINKFQKELSNRRLVQLKYNENNLKIKFASLMYTIPSAIVYEYMLEGFDKEWQILSGGQNEVTYNSLPGGRYQFRVRTDGNKDSESVVRINVSSYFSFTFWLIVVAAGILVYLLANKLLHYFRMLKEQISRLSSNQKEFYKSRKQDDKYKYSKISEEESKLVFEKLLNYIETEKPFSNSELKIADLAQAIHCSSHTLSYIFNQYLKKNYYDFINEYRIGEFKKIVGETDSSKYTLSALAEQCGFSSRASFFRSFKKLTGITPNEYIRSIGKNLYVIEDE